MPLNIWGHFLPLPATTFQKRNTRWSSEKSTSYFFQPALLICIGTGDTFIHTCHGWHETVGKGETRSCACQRQVILIYAIFCDCCEFDLRNLFWLSKDNSYCNVQPWTSKSRHMLEKCWEIRLELFQERNKGELWILLSWGTPGNHIRKTRRNIPGVTNTSIHSPIWKYANNEWLLISHNVLTSEIEFSFA